MRAKEKFISFQGRLNKHCFYTSIFRVIPLKSVYVDTTFLCPNMPDLPTRVRLFMNVLFKDCLISIVEDSSEITTVIFTEW